MTRARYEKYQEAKTFGQYPRLNAGQYAQPDAKYDLEKGFLIMFE